MYYLKKLVTLIIAVVMVTMYGTMLCINSLASEENLNNAKVMPKVCDLIPMIESSYCYNFTNRSVTLVSSTSDEWPSNPLNNIKSTSGIQITTAISYIGDYDSSQKDKMKDDFENAILDFEDLYNIEIDIVAVDSTVTNTYNCHAYAWYGAPSNGLCWIRDPQEFFDDPHCDTISSNNIYSDSVQIGDIVYFHSSTTGAVHSSIVDSITYVGGKKKIRLESKFGACGVYTHSFEDTAYFYDYNYYTVYRYAQNEHCEVYSATNATQHIVTCSPYKGSCAYVELHTTNYTSLGSNTHRAYCSQCGFNATEEHDLYLYADYGEDGCIAKCRDCAYLINCPEAVEFDPSGAAGHYVGCPSGEFSFFEEHNNNCTIIMNNLYYHQAVCLDCGYSYLEDHTWQAVIGGYTCTDCGMTSTIVPGDVMSLTDEELEALLATLSDEEIAALIAGLDPEARNRVTSVIAPPEDDFVTE